MQLKILMQAQSPQPKKATPCTKTQYNTQIIKIGSSVLNAKLTLLTNTQNPMLYNAFQLVRHHQKCPFRGASRRHVIHVP